MPELTPHALSPLSGLALIDSDEHVARFSVGGKPLEVSFPLTGIVRIRLGEPDGADYPILADLGPALALKTGKVEGGYCLAAGDLELDLLNDPLCFILRKAGKVIFHSTTDRHFRRSFRLPPFAETERGLFAAFNLDSGHPVFGLGEKYGPLNRRGQLVVSQNEDALGVNAEISYKNTPFAWSPAGWGLFVNTPTTVRHGVGYPQWSHRTYGLEVESSELDLFLIAAEGPTEILERYTALTGRPAKPPRWSYGLWLSKAFYKTADEALSTAQTLREKRMPCDVFTLDGRAWLDTSTRFAFEWDADRYPDPKAFTQKIKDLKLRVCVWEYPLISQKHPLFAELASRDWLLKDEDGAPYVYHWDPAPFGTVLTPLPPSGLVDFTHPDAYAWYAKAHQGLFDSGIDVIKSDFGEQVPRDAHAANGDDGRRLHNVYPLLYNRCVYEATQDHFGADAMVWARSGWSGSQTAPIQWGGDPEVSWEGLAASIRGGQSWGMSGCPYYSHDIGGFYGGDPDPELYVRWVQAGVLSSHCRMHGIGEREPWAFGQDVEVIVRDWLELRYRLIPYLEDCADQAEMGLPVMRAMAVACPEDPAAWAFDEQYMLGDDLFVAPVLQPGGRVRFYLPKGTWYDFWTEEPVTGGQVLERDVSLRKAVLFVREGARLPLGPVVQHTGALNDSNRIETLRLYGPEGGDG
ncbi:TIM-barrel domain-containing protein [Denitrobaculum tricleocarpae]|uniref:Alpha-xylosidase n=1 Tax=Denitrobaculum tricleocarpae TaxID=2591009 RepID=A0A545SZ88_9PROT|nr:TIM-barrel domain-containing protein [Denitrobaculum tricleocarpae]TQV70286.1 alpha-xylosidase [Denitrobaculum tricleocarpae]